MYSNSHKHYKNELSKEKLFRKSFQTGSDLSCWFSVPLSYIIKRTQISLTSLTILKINSPTNQSTSEGSETSADKYLTRQIQSSGYIFVGAIFSLVSKIRGQKMITENIPGRFEFSLLRAFQRWSRDCFNTKT